MAVDVPLDEIEPTTPAVNLPCKGERPHIVDACRRKGHELRDAGRFSMVALKDDATRWWIQVGRSAISAITAHPFVADEERGSGHGWKMARGKILGIRLREWWWSLHEAGERDLVAAGHQNSIGVLVDMLEYENNP